MKLRHLIEDLGVVGLHPERHSRLEMAAYLLQARDALLSSPRVEGERDQIVMDWMRARADWDTEVGEACRTILNVFLRTLSTG